MKHAQFIIDVQIVKKLLALNIDLANSFPLSSSCQSIHTSHKYNTVTLEDKDMILILSRKLHAPYKILFSRIDWSDLLHA